TRWPRDWSSDVCSSDLSTCFTICVPGGQIRTRREAGFVVEDGAEGWVAADRDVPALCHAVGIGAQIVKQVERRSLLVTGGKVVRSEERRVGKEGRCGCA